MKKLAATLLMALCGIALMGAAPANADTTTCRTAYPILGGSVMTCDTYTNDGGRYTTVTYCDKNGNCTANTH